MTAPSLRERFARAVHEEQSVDAVLAVLADADPTDLGMERTGTAWLTVPGVCNHGSWDHCPRTDHKVDPFYARPRTEETPDA